MTSKEEAQSPSHEAGLGSDYESIQASAFSYLAEVKAQFEDKPEVYNRFVEILGEYQEQKIDVEGTIAQAGELFREHPALLERLALFLPAGYKLEDEGDGSVKAVKTASDAKPGDVPGS